MQTLKGSKIARYRNKVGKRVGNKIYVHWSYAGEIIPNDVLLHAYRVMQDCGYMTSCFNCLRYDLKTEEVTFQECPWFDEQREPMVGNYVTVAPNSHYIKTGFTQAIFHHKWLWVMDDYEGFDVADSKQWSKYWLARLP